MAKTKQPKNVESGNKRKVPASEGNASIIKPVPLIMSIEAAEFTRMDRLLFNFLVYKARSKYHQAIYEVAVSEVLNFLGHRKLARLSESLERLGKSSIRVKVADANKKDLVEMQGHYLSYELTRTENGVLRYAFDRLVLEVVQRNRGGYAQIDVNRSSAFTLGTAAKLHEILNAYVRREQKTFHIDVEDAIQLFTPGSKDDPRDFYRRTVKPMVDQYNERAELWCEAEPIRAGRGGKIVGFKFTPRLRNYLDKQEVEVKQISKRILASLTTPQKNKIKEAIERDQTLSGAVEAFAWETETLDGDDENLRAALLEWIDIRYQTVAQEPEGSLLDLMVEGK